MMKKLFRITCLCFAAFLLVSCFYLTCITEVQKAWLDMDVGPFYPHTTGPLYEGTVYEQHFIAQRSIVDEIQVRIITWEREYAPEDQLSVALIADLTGETVAECSIPLSGFADNQMYPLPFSGSRLVKGAWYTLRFAGNAAEENHSISIMQSDRGEPGWEFCTTNAEDAPMEQNLAIVIRGRGMF